MTALSTFIEQNINREVQLSLDYTGPCGWVHLTNSILRRLGNEKLVVLDQYKSVGVEAVDGHWIILPANFRSRPSLFYCVDDENIPVKFKIINGKLCTDLHMDYDSDPDTFSLSSGGLTSVVIDDADAVEDEYAGKLLVLTNGTYSGDTVVIGSNDAALLGSTTLYFLHARTDSISASTTGYITGSFLMLEYIAKFTGLSSSASILPVDEKYYDVLKKGLLTEVTTIGSKERDAYRQEYEYEISLLKNELRTPTPEQARRLPRVMAGLDIPEYIDTNTDFVGDLDAWMQ